MSNRVFPEREVWMAVLGEWSTTTEAVVSMGSVRTACNIGDITMGMDARSVNRGQIGGGGPQFHV